MRRAAFAFAVIWSLSACKGKEAPKTPDTRCVQLGKACADTDKHIAKLAEDCMMANKPNCGDKASALYDCYEKELCGKADKIWALQDLGVLADRNGKCAAEKTAFKDCK
jgi:hypothetical protein